MATHNHNVPADKIQLEIVTQRGRALDALVDEVTAPSVKGEFGVMPGHLPLLAATRTGLVTYRQGGETKKCAIASGLAEAGSNRLIILTSDYAVREDIDPVLVRKELGEVDAELERIDPTAPGADAEGLAEKRTQLIERENWLAALLELYGDPPPATMRPHEEYGPPPIPQDEENERLEAPFEPPAF
jgi:F-type H+-transporting ATPase subunit epsilon